MNKQRVTHNVPGIPLAPIGRRLFQAVDYDYLDRKKRLAHRLPFYTKDEVNRRKHPYHVIMMHDMMTADYFTAVQEMHKIFRKDEAERIAGRHKHIMKPTLVSQRPIVELIAKTLKLCQDFVEQDEFEAPTVIRKNLGEKFMKDGEVWLARHFLESSLESCEEMMPSEKRDKLEAETNCLLAFIARDSSEDLEEALENAVDHLVVCRTLAKDQSWQFKPRILSIRLKKPIALHGLRDDYEVVDGCSMTLYRVATLLEHEMLIGLANDILHSHRAPTMEELQQAHIFADNALRLAFEVRQPVALSSALMRFGVVLRHTGAFDDAILYFKQMGHHAEITGDQETYAIAYHNIALCHTGRHESVEALKCLVRQKEVADMFRLEDLQADALQELGLLLLQEGQEWESEECYASAYESFDRLETANKPPHSHTKTNLAMSGVAAGQKLWSRFAGLVRSDRYDDLCGLMEWKNRRAALPSVARPNYEVQSIEELYMRYYPSAYFDEIRPSTTATIATPFEGEDDEEEEEGDKPRRKSVGFEAGAKAEEASEGTPVSPPTDDDKFASDYDHRSSDSDEDHEYRKLSAKRSSSMKHSMTSAMESRKTLSFPMF